VSGSSYIWIGGTAGAWSNAANWQNLTTETVAAIAPGVTDDVTIDGTVTVFGTGGARRLTILGQDAVSGDLSVGTLVVDGIGPTAATLDIHTGGTVSALAGTVIGMISVSGNAAALEVDGSLQVGSGSSSGGLQASSGALLQAGGMVLSANDSNYVDVDRSSTIEIGNAGCAAAGALTIDPGFTLSGSGSPNFSIIGNIVNNGLIRGGVLALGEVLVYSSGRPGSISSGAILEDSLSGTGTVEVWAHGAITLQEPITTSEITIQLDGTANLNIEASIAAGNTINLIGSANTLTIDDQYYLRDKAGVYTGGQPTVGASVKGFNSSDRLVYVNDPFLGITITAASYADRILTLLDGGTTIEALSLTGDYAGEMFSVAADPAAISTEAIITLSDDPPVTVEPSSPVSTPIVACFAAGTRIATPRGAIRIERLREGDTVVTVSGKPQPIQWIGRRTLDCIRHISPDRVKPIRIAPHAFGENRPRRTLLLSPDHSIYVEDVLIPVKFLVNRATLRQIEVATVTYYHLELARHDVVLAEGLPVETYLETGGRSAFENSGGAMQLHPNFAPNEALVGMVWQNFCYAPLLGTDGQLDRVRARLAWQALMLGYRSDGTQPLPKRITKR
jgi:Hint domain